jgi:DNA-binding XRE family transcriptional regulator
MNDIMKTKVEEFEVLIPSLDGSGIMEKVMVPVTLEWDEEVKEWLLTPEAHQMIEDTKARHIGLLLPAQLKELRERYGYTQKEMGELFQAGEKSWTRWESGKHRPSRSINLLICALYEGEISINYLLKRAGKPPCEEKSAQVEISPWASVTPLTTEMDYIIFSGAHVIHRRSKVGGKAKFVKAFLEHAEVESLSPWRAIASRKQSRGLIEAGSRKRFDYQDVNLA